MEHLSLIYNELRALGITPNYKGYQQAVCAVQLSVKRVIQITGHIVNLIRNAPNPKRRGQSIQTFPLSLIAIFNPAFSLRPYFSCRVEGLNRRSIFHDSLIRDKGSVRICYVNDSAEISGPKFSLRILLDNITDFCDDIT